MPWTRSSCTSLKLSLRNKKELIVTQLDLAIFALIRPTIAITTAPPTPPPARLDRIEETSKPEPVAAIPAVDAPPEVNMLSN
jgi:hypothetical protein